MKIIESGKIINNCAYINVINNKVIIQREIIPDEVCVQLSEPIEAHFESFKKRINKAESISWIDSKRKVIENYINVSTPDLENGITIEELWNKCLQQDNKVSKIEEMQIAKLLTNLGLIKKRKMKRGLQRNRWYKLNSQTVTFSSYEPEHKNETADQKKQSIQFEKNWWIYKNRIFYIKDEQNIPFEEIKLKIKYFLLKKEKEFLKISKEIESFERSDKNSLPKREKLLDAVKIFVWQRDEGKCVKCGSNEKLEFDHIIPIVKGGSSTERNIQLLCEHCNRSKSANL